MLDGAVRSRLLGAPVPVLGARGVVRFLALQCLPEQNAATTSMHHSRCDTLKWVHLVRMSSSP